MPLKQSEPPDLTDKESLVPVRIQLFSVLRECMQSRFIDVTISGQMEADAFIDAVCEQHPRISGYRSLMNLAVNQTYARQGDLVGPGDEVALITPVSGG